MIKASGYLSGVLICLFLSAGVLSPAVCKAAQDPAALAASVQKRYKKIQSIRAAYHRTSRFVAAGDQKRQMVKGQGVLIWARPVSLRLEQEKPRPELVVVGTEVVWWVRLNRRRADIYPPEQFTSGLRPLLDALGGLARLDKSFDLASPGPSEEKLGQGGPVLVLTPRQKRMDLKRLVIWFEPGELVLKGFRTISLVGDVTQYDLENVEINPNLPPETFTYQPPADFRVIDHRIRR